MTMSTPSTRILLLALAAGALFLFQPTVSEGGERLSYRAQKHYQKVAREMQKPPKRNTARPAMRVIMGTSVNKNEDKPVFDEALVSSPEVIFHLENGRVVSGHAYDR